MMSSSAVCKTIFEIQFSYYRSRSTPMVCEHISFKQDGDKDVGPQYVLNPMHCLSLPVISTELCIVDYVRWFKCLDVPFKFWYNKIYSL